MDITLSHPDFKTQLLEIRISGHFRAPRILLNGALVKRLNGAYTVLNDAGQEVTIQINTNVFYRLPELFIERDSVQISGKSGWSQFAGWEKTRMVQSTRSGLKIIAAIMSIKKLNKSA